MSIHERIVECRKHLDLNQTQLADLAGLTAPTISQYESGKRKPSSKALFQLSKSLQVTPSYLLYGRESHELHLGEEDKEFLILFKTLSPKDKKTVFDFLKYMATKEL